MENGMNAAPQETSMNQVDVSQGIPVNVAPDMGQMPVGTPTQPVEGQTAPDPTRNTPEELKAAGERLKQQNARQAKLLHSLGIDPLSDIGEQLENGLITPEMVVNHVVNRQGGQRQTVEQPVQQMSNDPISQAQAEYEAAKAACDTEGQTTGQVSFETMRRYTEAGIKLQEAKAESVTRQFTVEQEQKRVNENVDQVLTVARNSDYYPQFADNAKQTSDLVHVALAGALAYQEAPKMGLDPNRLNPQQTRYFASKAAEQLGVLAENLIQLGRQQALQSMNPGKTINQKPVYVPAGPGGQAVGVTNQFARANHTNHTDLARQYVAGLRPVV